VRKVKKSRASKARRQAASAGARLAVACLAITACIILFLSCLSFDIGDPPSTYRHPANDPPLNWCGSAGAFAAYYLLYYFGPGVFFILVSALCFLVARVAHKRFGQAIFRVIGLMLLTAVASCTFYCFWPHKIYAFPTPLGSGGVLGVSLVTLLREKLAPLGTTIVLAFTWLAGLALLADSLVAGVLAVFGMAVRRIVGLVVPAARKRTETIGEIWQKLSVRQKSLSDRTADAESESEEEVEEADESVAAEVDAGDEGEPVAPATVKRPAMIEVRQTKERREQPPFVQPSYDDYVLPPLSLLDESEHGYAEMQEKVVKSKAAALEKLLSEFHINARVAAADTGPVVTMFELELAAGVKVSQISNLSNDIARALGVGAVRIVAPLPGKHTIGIEVPNSEKEKVRIKSMMELGGARAAKMEIPLFLGKDSSGEALVSDLAKMPHLLIAGTTGSGKSVCINSIIVSVALTKRPDEVKMILVDPKMVEMTSYSTIPHLMCPIVTETQTAVQILEWATVKMDERYALLAEARVKNIFEFNALGKEEIIARFNPSSPDEEAKIPKRLPYVVIIIDELADLMMTAPKEIEAYIVRLAQKSRAVGIHIVLATQRPQATVVTGLIKSNMPCRISFRVAARMDSRIILDQNGAEALLGEGDMLFLKPGTSDLIRAQGTFLDEMEIRRIIKHLKDIAEPQFHPELTQLRRVDTTDMPRDELFDEAVSVVLETKRGSVSLLQRRLGVGYARASRMIETMASTGILGEYKGSQAREVLVTLEEYEQMCQQADAQAPPAFGEPSQSPEGETPVQNAGVTEGQQGYMSSYLDEED
jgi:S-DNA-T family DNA segregation ATPase FtsK/SpoIIIE